MKQWITLAVIAVSVILPGCGGGGGSTNSTDNNKAANYSISGTATSMGSGLQGVTMTLNNSTTTTTDASGFYTFTGLANGSYTVTPSKSGYTFTPANSLLALNDVGATGINFRDNNVTTPIVACTSYNYSAWSACQPDGLQARTIFSSDPAGCVGTPILMQSCTYVPSPIILENTSRAGNVYGNELWKGVIDITGDVTIMSGAVVTIEPGTVVRFAAGSDNQSKGGNAPITDKYFPNDPAVPPSKMSTIGVFGGTLNAVGTADKNITFTSSSQNPTPSDWQSLQYIKDGSKLIVQYSIIEYGYYGIQINDIADDSNVILKNNTIRHIVACGICCGIDPARPVTVTISDNDISYCGHEGVDTHANANVIVERNVFHDNSINGAGSGIVVDNNNSIIRDNQFLLNRIGINIISANSYPVIKNNVFSGNGTVCNGYCPHPLQ